MDLGLSIEDLLQLDNIDGESHLESVLNTQTSTYQLLFIDYNGSPLARKISHQRLASYANCNRIYIKNISSADSKMAWDQRLQSILSRLDAFTVEGIREGQRMLLVELGDLWASALNWTQTSEAYSKSLQVCNTRKQLEHSRISLDRSILYDISNWSQLEHPSALAIRNLFSGKPVNFINLLNAPVTDVKLLEPYELAICTLLALLQAPKASFVFSSQIWATLAQNHIAYKLADHLLNREKESFANLLPKLELNLHPLFSRLDPQCLERWIQAAFCPSQ